MNQPQDEHARPALFISYHYHPSTEIGGRRVGAFVAALARRGVPSVVVSAFGGAALDSTCPPLVGLLPCQVAESGPLRLVESAVALKRAASRWLVPQDIADAAQTEPAATPSAPRGDATGSFARQLFFRTLHVIDPHKRWAWRAANAAVAQGRQHPPRVVVASGPPMSSLLAAAKVSKRLGVPLVLDLRDPWVYHGVRTPDEALGIPALTRIAERYALSAASAITCVSTRLAATLRSVYPGLADRIVEIPNGFDGDVRRLSTDTGRRLGILYAGELYVHRDPMPLFEALDQLLAEGADPTRVVLRIVAREPTYRGTPIPSIIAGRPCAAVVEVLPPATPAEVEALSSQATVLLNLAQNQPMQVPAKTYEHLASGREVLVLCEKDSETAHVASTVRSGVLQVDPAEPGSLLRTLRDLYERHVVLGRLTCPNEEEVRQHARVSGSEHFARLVEAVVQGGPPR